MIKTGFNQNDLEALRRLGEPSVQSSSMLSSSMLSASMAGEAFSSMPIPSTPSEGVLVKISHAGACYDEGKTRKKFAPKFPGTEIAGTIQDIGKDSSSSNFSVGDRVVIIPDEDHENTGYAESIAVDDMSRVMLIPNNMKSEVAAMLPGSALTAYAAVNAAKPHVEKLRKVKSCVNVLIVGGFGVGLWTVKIAQYLMGKDCNNVRLFVADNSIERLLTADDHGCHDIIHWNEEDHEQYIIERTLASCRGGVDVIIDFVASHRSMQRSLKVLNREGLILIGGNSTCETSIPLNALAAKQQSIVGVPKGNINQLSEIMQAIGENKLEVPKYEVFTVEDSKQVFDDLCEDRLTGRAIFKFGSHSSTTNGNLNKNLNEQLDNQ